MGHVHPSSNLHLTKLSIQNFRGIDDLELNLMDGTADPLDVVVLGGGNGSGKTSVLEAVILLLNLPELLPDDAAPLPEQVRFGADAGCLAGAFRWKPESDAEPADFGGRLPLGSASTTA